MTPGVLHAQHRLDPPAVHQLIELFSIVLVVSSLAAGAIASYDFTRSFFGALAMVAAPLLVGSGSARVLSKILGKRVGGLDVFELAVFEWCLGTGVLFSACFVLSALGIFALWEAVAFSTLFVPVVLLGRPHDELTISVKRADFPFLVAAVALAVVAVAYLRIGSPFPYAPTWDTFQDAFIANRIRYLGEFHLLTSSYSPLVFQISDIRALPLLEAFASLASGGSVLGVAWWGSFALAPIMAVGVYILAGEAGLPRMTAFVGSIASVWLMEFGGESGIPVFRTAAVLMTLAPFVFAALLRGRRAGFTFSFLSLGLLVAFFSAEDAAFVVAIAVGLVVFEAASRRLPTRFLLGLLSTAFSIGLFSILLGGYWPDSLPAINLFSTRYSANAIFYQAAVALRFLEQTFTQAGYASALVGTLAFSLVLLVRNDRSKVYTVAALASSSLIAYFLPVSFSTRVIVYAQSFVALMMAAAVTLPLNRLPSRMRLGRMTLKTVAYILVLAILLVAVLPGSVGSIHSRVEAASPLGQTSFSSYDYQMGNWLKANAPANATLVGAPGDQQIQMGLSYRQTLGGNYMSVALQREVKAALYSGNATISSCALSRIVGNGSTPVVILSGRTVAWMQQPNNFNVILYPLNMTTLPSWAGQFNDSTRYQLAHQVGDQIFAYYVISSVCAPPSAYTVPLSSVVAYSPGGGKVGRPSLMNTSSGEWLSIPAGTFVEAGVSSSTLGRDFSGFTSMNVTIQGTGGGGAITFYVWAPDAQDLFKYQMTDNFNGTTQMVIPLYLFSAVKGSPSWTSVSRVVVTWRTTGNLSVPAITFTYSPP